MLLKIHLDIIDSLKAEVDAAVRRALEPIASNAEILKTIPSVSDVVAHVILAEIGSDMSRFETADQLISWAGFCPRNNESAGNRRSTRLRSGGTCLKATRTTATWRAIKNRHSHPAPQYARIKARRGAKKAIVAVAASMLTAAYHMLRNGAPYREIGASHYDERSKAKTSPGWSSASPTSDVPSRSDPPP